jgi:hypothetical protein
MSLSFAQQHQIPFQSFQLPTLQLENITNSVGRVIASLTISNRAADVVFVIFERPYQDILLGHDVNSALVKSTSQVSNNHIHLQPSFSDSYD